MNMLNINFIINSRNAYFSSISLLIIYLIHIQFLKIHHQDNELFDVWLFNLIICFFLSPRYVK